MDKVIVNISILIKCCSFYSSKNPEKSFTGAIKISSSTPHWRLEQWCWKFSFDL